MKAPLIYRSINAIARELAKIGVRKTHVNEIDGYDYRSMDDLLDALSPLLARQGVCVFPRMREREFIERRADGGHLLTHVALRVSFDLVSIKDGSSHVVEAFGEALDVADKATAKAATAAFKSAMVQTFCIPFSGTSDPEARTARTSASKHPAEPIAGWEQWSEDIKDIVSVCETSDAISVVQDRYRELLKGLSRERPHLYRELGECFTNRRQTIAQAGASSDVMRPHEGYHRKAAPADEDVVHA